MRLSVLSDMVATQDLCTEFGLSLLLEDGERRFLFDTGAGHALLPNATAMKIPLTRLTAIILSHGHADHTGGLAQLRPDAPVFVGPDIKASCCSLHDDGQRHWLTMPQASQDVLNQSDVRIIRHPSEIYPDVFLTGPIPRLSSEDCGGHFFSDDACTLPTIIPEEQALWLSDGVLVTGCCHAGIINTIEACRRDAPDRPIRIIIGGLHLLHADTNRLRQTADFLKTLHLEKMILLHCTGEHAIDFLKQNLDCPIIRGIAGRSYDI